MDMIMDINNRSTIVEDNAYYVTDLRLINETSNYSLNNDTYFLPYEEFFIFLNHMTVYVLPVEIIVGCVGNLLACYVLVTSHLIQQSFNVYLAFLTLVDTGFLVCTLFVWIDFITPRHSAAASASVFSLNGFCQGIPYLTYVFSFLSGYTVVSFTVERFIVTFYPLHRQHMCTSKRAKLVVAGLTLFALLFYSFPLYMSTVVNYGGYRECRPLMKFIKAATILASIDSVITLLLPSVIIIVLNMAIGIKISHIFSDKSRRRLGHYRGDAELQGLNSDRLLGESSTEQRQEQKCISVWRSKRVAGGIRSSNARWSARSQQPLVRRMSSADTCRSAMTRTASTGSNSGSRSQVRTTRTLIVLSSVFVLLKLPSHALRLHTFIHSFLQQQQALDHSDTMWLLAWQELCQFIYYLNFAGNFFLYCLFSHTFRAVAKSKSQNMVHCFKTQRNSSNM